MSGEICKDLSLAGMSQIEEEFSAGPCQFGCSWLQITTEQDKRNMQSHSSTSGNIC